MISDILAGLAQTLDQVDGLRAFDRQPESISPPTVICEPNELTYDVTLDGCFDLGLKITVLVSRADARTSQSVLYDYIDPGTSTIKGALDSEPTLGGTVSYWDNFRYTGMGLFTVAGVDYLGVTFELVAHT